MRLLPLLLAAAAPALLVLTFLTGAAPDDEELRWGILSSFLHVRALADGTLLSWTSTLGFGMPQPMVPNFNFHPLVPLLGVMSAAAWTRLLYIAHTVVGATGVWWLCRALGVTPVVRGVAVLTHLLATPTSNYALTDLWPSHYVMWTTGPWLLLLARRLLTADRRESARDALVLGLAGGVALATTHPGHAPVYAPVIVAVLAAHRDAAVARARWLLLAVLIALAIASPNLVQLISEQAVFDDQLAIVKFPEPLPPSSAWDLFLKPLSDIWKDVGPGEARGIFFGGPFAALALVGLVWLGRRHADLAIGVLLSGVLLFTPLLPLTFLSRYQFRDAMLLCAIPLAAVTTDALLGARRSRTAAAVLLVLQCVAVTGGALPHLRRVWGAGSAQATAARGATAATADVDRLLAAMTAPGRVAYAPQADYEISERGWLRQGLGVNALAYRGVPLVNGSFKSISNDGLWPDERQFYGRIRTPAPFVADDAALDLLGVRYLLARRGEVVAPGLREVLALMGESGVLLLYENPDAGPGAFLIDRMPEALPELPVHADCSNDRLLCRDLTPLAQLRTGDDVTVTRHGHRIDLAYAAAPAPRLLVVAEMYRPGWTARAAHGPLRAVSVGPGLVGVVVPGGTSAIRLEYQTRRLTSTTVLAWCVLIAGIGAACALSRRRRSPETGALE